MSFYQSSLAQFIFRFMSTAVSLVLLTSTAHAYVTITETDNRTIGVFTLNGRTASFEYGRADSFRPLEPVVDARNKIFSEIRTGVDSALRAELQKISQYRGHTTTVAGPVQFELNGIPNQRRSRITLTGPSITVDAGFEQNFRGINIVRCQAILSTGSIVLSEGVYDPDTGAITGLRFTNGVNPSKTENCTTLLGLIPGLGRLIDQLVTRVIGGFVDVKIEERLANIRNITLAYNLGGLGQALPGGRFMFDGTDYGLYLRDNLVNFLTQDSIVFRFTEPRKLGLVAEIQDQRDEVFLISLSKPGISFKVDSRVLRTVRRRGN